MSYEVLVKTISSGLAQFRVLDAVDILLMAFLVYRLILLTRETRAYQLLKGLAIIFLAALATDALQISTISWLLNSLLVSGVVVIVVLFQPELRRVFEHLGRGKFLTMESKEAVSQDAVSELQSAVLHMAKRRVGALIVIEQRTGLGDIIGTGTRIDGIISAPLIENIFEPNTPLHDGAVIIRDGLIVSAACFLPLVEDITVARELGTRHRAALGVSSMSDSVTIVVSEETGVISCAREGKLIRYMDEKALKDTLESVFGKEKNAISSLFKPRKKNEK